ncbi:MAG: trigger factor [Candidatus Paceibacterota bacterium]|jgi:trigger factor
MEINKLKNSEVEIIGEISAEDFKKYEEKAFEKLGENIEVDGFRKGKVPRNILEGKIPEMSILEEMAEMALAENYPKIIIDNKIDAISRPEISITKIAKGEALGFKIKTAVMPEVKLTDYKKIASAENKDKIKVEVTDEEFEKTILEIRKMRAPKFEGQEEEHKCENENCEHKPAEIKAKSDAVGSPDSSKEEFREEDLPTLDDDFVKTLGKFENVEDFKNKLKENIQKEKEVTEKQKKRLKIVEKIIEESVIELPRILIDVELDKMMHQMKGDILAMGLPFEDYLKHLQKTEDDIKKDWEKEAEKRAKLQLIINKIPLDEKIEAEKDAVQKELDVILEQYKDADPERARIYVESVLTNEKVFQFLENL